MKVRISEVVVFLALSLLLCAPISAADYDPLVIPKAAPVRSFDVTMRDKARRRDIPLRIYLPTAKEPASVVLFSHGLGGTCKGGAFLGNHWAGRGYAVVCLQHVGSDDSVWRNEPRYKRMGALKQAASARNLMLRAGDVSAVLDQLEVWNREKGNRLAGRLDLSRVGMSGHSFGAVTTQAVSGQSLPLVGQRFGDKRIRAAIAFSPSSPRAGDSKKAFGAVKIPWMLMTGTEDTSPIGGQTVESRRKVYPNLPATVDKYELVLCGAKHSAFSDRARPRDKGSRNPNHHRAILALSTAFWDAYLRGDAAALAWLQGKGAKAVLEEKDGWRVQEGRKRQ